MSYGFLIFDLDGTLIDSQYDLTTAVNLMRKDFVLSPLPTEKVRSHLGSGVRALVADVLPEIKGKENEALQSFFAHYQEHILDATKPFDGVARTLEILKSKKMAVLSNKTEKFCREILSRLGLSKYFTEIFGGDSSSERKPSPKPVLDLIKLTHSIAESTVLIGDSANDFLAAKAAGIDSIAVSYGYMGAAGIKEFSPSHTVNKFSEIIEIVK